MKKKSEENRFYNVRQVGLLSTIPILLVASPLIGFFMGRFLDNKLHTDPILTIVFIIFGFIAGGRQVANVLKLANRDMSEKDKKRGP